MIVIDDKYYIKTDDRCYTLMRKAKKSDKVCGYFSTIRGALKEYASLWGRIEYQDKDGDLVDVVNSMINKYTELEKKIEQMRF